LQRKIESKKVEKRSYRCDSPTVLERKIKLNLDSKKTTIRINASRGGGRRRYSGLRSGAKREGEAG